MNNLKTLVSTAVAISVAGAMGFAYAQSNAENINVKGPNNLTQTQSDAALPCQPGPFNPHLPKDSKSTRSTTNNNSADCSTVTRTQVQVIAPAAAPVVVQSDTALPNQPAPFSPSVQVAPQPVASSFQNDATVMTTERDAQADRN
jgi:hypothetical protein